MPRTGRAMPRTEGMGRVTGIADQFTANLQAAARELRQVNMVEGYDEVPATSQPDRPKENARWNHLVRSVTAAIREYDTRGLYCDQAYILTDEWFSCGIPTPDEVPIEVFFIDRFDVEVSRTVILRPADQGVFPFAFGGIIHLEASDAPEIRNWHGGICTWRDSLETCYHGMSKARSLVMNNESIEPRHRERVRQRLGVIMSAVEVAIDSMMGNDDLLAHIDTLPPHDLDELERDADFAAEFCAKLSSIVNTQIDRNRGE